IFKRFGGPFERLLRYYRAEKRGKSLINDMSIRRSGLRSLGGPLGASAGVSNGARNLTFGEVFINQRVDFDGAGGISIRLRALRGRALGKLKAARSEQARCLALPCGFRGASGESSA